MKPMWWRVVQFFGALTATVRPDELDTVMRYLEPPQMALFQRMTVWDQRHSLDVFARLQANGNQDPDLLRAALLHDVGKSRARVTVWHRVLVVLLAGVRKDWLKRLAAVESGWRQPVAAIVWHSAAGASLAADAGCSATVQEYIREHDNPQATGPVLWLQWADGQVVNRSKE
jgi:hypothetical protein